MGSWNRKSFKARYPGRCHKCNQHYTPGAEIALVVVGPGRGAKGGNRYAHSHCASEYAPLPPFPVVQIVQVEEYKPATLEERLDASEETQDIESIETEGKGETVQEKKDNLADLIAAAVSDRLKPQMDEAKIKLFVAELVSKAVTAAAARFETRTIKLTLPDRPEPVTIEGAHYLMPRLLRLLASGLPLYLWGPAGSGKSTAALMAAAALQRGHELDTLDPSTFRSMVQGYCTPTGTPVHTSFTRAWSEGRIYIAEECDNAPGHVQTLFNTALANGHAPLAWGNAARKEGFGFIANGNTPGRPTAEFPDRRPMSAAFRDRMYFVHWPIDPAIELRAASLPVPPLEAREEKTCTPQAWVKWVCAVRAWAEKNAPTIVITPRASLDGLKALQVGETPREVAEALVFRGADPALVKKALDAVELP